MQSGLEQSGEEERELKRDASPVAPARRRGDYIVRRPPPVSGFFLALNQHNPPTDSSACTIQPAHPKTPASCWRCSTRRFNVSPPPSLALRPLRDEVVLLRRGHSHEHTHLARTYSFCPPKARASTDSKSSADGVKFGKRKQRSSERSVLPPTKTALARSPPLKSCRVSLP